MKIAFRLLSMVLFMLLIMHQNALTQDAGVDPLTSYQRANQVFMAGIQAMGGVPTLLSMRNMQVKITGQVTDHTQSHDPRGSHEPKPVSVTCTYDFTKDQLACDMQREFLGGVIFDVGFSYNRPSNTYATIPAAALPSWDFLFRSMPQVILHRALRKTATLRWIGESTLENRKQNVVSLSLNDVLYTMYFDDRTKLLSNIEILQPLPVDGDALMSYGYSDYQTFGATMFPARITWKRAGHDLFDLRTQEVVSNQELAADLFEPPKGATLITPTGFETESLAEGVLLIKGPKAFFGNPLYYNTMAIDLGESVLVVDAPLASAFAGPVIKIIQQAMPGKPIKHLVSTHFHYDHSGGARPFMAAGATIVTTKGNQAFFRKLAGFQSTLAPDGLQIDPAKLDFLLVAKERRIKGSKRTVEVYNVGPLEHVKEMLLVYLPEEKILFQADLFSDTAAPNRTMGEFVQRLKKLKLKIDKIAGVHAPVVTMKEVEAAAKAFRDISMKK